MCNAANGHSVLSDVVPRLRRGEVDALEDIMSKYERRIFGLVFRILGNFQTAQEVTQDIFLKMWKRPDILGDGSEHRLFAIAHNAAVDAFRKTRRRPEVGVIEIGKIEDVVHPSPENLCRIKEVLSAVLEQIHRLSPKQKSAILLVGSGLDQRDAAQVMNTTHGNFRVILSAGRNKLIKEVEKLKSKGIELPFSLGYSRKSALAERNAKRGPTP